MSTTALSPGKQRLQDAIDAFCASVSAADRSKLPSSPHSRDVTDLVSQANSVHSTWRSRRFGDRIQPFLKAVNEFSTVVDVMVQSNPEIASLVWGSIKFVMIILLAHNKYFEEGTAILERIGRYCPLFEEFSNLLPDASFQDVLCEFYAVIINFCESFLGVLRQKPVKSFLKITFSSLKGEFKEFTEKIERHKTYVDGHIQLASEREHNRERQANAHFRNQLVDYTKGGIQRRDQSSHWKLQQDQRQKAMRRDILLEKITSHNYHELYFRHLGKGQQGTGEWVFTLNNFVEWESGTSTSSILWCHGIPGSGKSVLTSKITNYLTTKYPRSTAFYFCDFNQKIAFQWETILRSIIKQLLSHLSVGDMSILERFETPVSQTALSDILRDIVNITSPCYLIFDAIDECDEPEKYQTLRILEQLSQVDHIRIWISGRYSLDISRKMSPNTVQEIDLALNIHPDIRLYIEQELEERIRVRRLTISDQMREEIKPA
ncbi:hypothetical protein TWF694_003407 [Orbilia ellipsospora]|uniref:NACHT domain-containing protein n=1 Tax=Orbilia ellipsospora TaxID=2528407 RepID=A0AAV9WY45_9PEZI